MRPLQHLLQAHLLPEDAGLPAQEAEFQAALQAAQQLHNLFLLGLVHSYHSRALARAGQSLQAQAARAEARAIFLRWGAHALVEQLDRAHPQPAPIAPPVHDATDTVLAVPASALDLSTLMKSVQAITAESALDELLTRLVHVLRENAGASRAAIVLGDHRRWQLQTDSSAAGSASVLEDLALEDAGHRLPLEILRTVLSTGQPVVARRQ